MQFWMRELDLLGLRYLRYFNDYFADRVSARSRRRGGQLDGTINRCIDYRTPTLHSTPVPSPFTRQPVIDLHYYSNPKIYVTTVLLLPAFLPALAYRTPSPTRLYCSRRPSSLD